VERLAILNVPHPYVARRHLTSDPEQQVRSLYAAFFQLPWLPEAVLGAFDWKVAEESMRNSSLPGTFSDEDMEAYRQAWSRPEAMTTMLNWYRASLQRPMDDWPEPRVVVPTTIIWGLKDFALRGEMAAESAAECDDAELIELPDNTHWVQHEAPELVNETLITRFKE
jgi:pimeloyl-ACP methyl ester carboxylesterase